MSANEFEKFHNEVSKIEILRGFMKEVEAIVYQKKKDYTSSFLQIGDLKRLIKETKGKLKGKK